MKKFLLFAFAAVMLGFTACSDNNDNGNGNEGPALQGYEAPVFMYGKTREEVKASVPYQYSGESKTSLYFKGKGIVKEFTYIFKNENADATVYSCGSIVSDLYTDDLHKYLSEIYTYLQYNPAQKMYVYENEDKSLSIGLYPIGDGLAAVEYLKN